MNYNFISSLIYNRENFARELFKNYTYDQLLSCFNIINDDFTVQGSKAISPHFANDNNNQIEICPNDKYVYRLLTGKYFNSKYKNSSFNYIPSKELVDGLLSLIKFFKINYIEEIYAGMGLLSSLMKMENKNLNIIASDTFTDISTCKQLGLFPIVNRNPKDFKYYEILNKEYPQMIISSYYPKTMNKYTDIKLKFVNQIFNLINNKKHKIIILLLPNTMTYIYNYFYQITLEGYYKIFTYHIKAIDKYFYINNLINDKYPSGMLIHIIIETKLLIDYNLTDIKHILGQAIIEHPIIDTQCNNLKIIKHIYYTFPHGVIKDIYTHCDLMKMMNNNLLNEMLTLNEKYISLKIYVPQYINTIHELLIWNNLISHKIYIIFNNRKEFIDFINLLESSYPEQLIELKQYEKNLDLQYSEQITDIHEKKNIYIPILLTKNEIYTFLYMCIWNKPDDWKYDYKQFKKIFKEINENGKKFFNNYFIE